MNITEELRHLTPEQVAARDDVRALRKREWSVLGVLLALAIIAFFNVKRVVVSGISMQPTFKSGQSVFVWTSIPRSSFKAGDIVVFHAPEGGEFIKRIVFIQNSQGTAQPSETVWTTDGDQPFVEIFEDFYKHGKNLVNVPPAGGRKIWVLGDNYMHSEDSRDFGPIAPSSILGKVIM